MNSRELVIASMSIDYAWSVALKTPNSRKEHEPDSRYSRLVLAKDVQQNLYKDSVKNYSFHNFYKNIYLKTDENFLQNKNKSLSIGVLRAEK